MKNGQRQPQSGGLPKSRTNIHGLDEITGGGLPRARATLVCGGAGCGKTLFGMEFLVHGAMQYNEKGVFVSFEETEKELTANVASLGFDLGTLVERKKIRLEHIRVERGEVEMDGKYDLVGLFIRIQEAIESIGAKRLVLDTIESLFSGLPDPAMLRVEMHRLLRWLKRKGVTTIVTAERGDGNLTRHGLE